MNKYNISNKVSTNGWIRIRYGFFLSAIPIGLTGAIRQIPTIPIILAIPVVLSPNSSPLNIRKAPNRLHAKPVMNRQRKDFL